ncbi:MAG: hypothetical protein ACJAWC_002784 [Yoonia sp.]|jgi:hypothetical protein
MSIRMSFDGAIAALALLLILTAGPASAQEAFIGQIGSNNSAGNFDLSGGALAAIAQIGDGNTSVQINEQGKNVLIAAQLGNRNTNLSWVNGTNNFVGTVQFGLGHTAISLITGNANQVVTLQAGGLNQSLVNLNGNNAAATVAQTGFGLRTNLRIQDSYTGPLTGADPLNVLINQSAGDPAVNASVTRDSSGTVIIRPGNATTVLQLPG